MHRLRTGIFAVILLLAGTSAAWAGAKEAMESLLMPGELSRVHARYEQTCDKCHENFKKQSQNRRCLDCHKEIRADLDDKAGWHGKVSGVRDRECRSCHTEHKGRGRDIAAFSEDTFDHEATDFPLKGRHGVTACVQCHRAEDKYRDAKSACIACHRDEDVHKGRLGEKCRNCHIEELWKYSRFDHDKTDFKLRDSHREVICADCHPNERFANTPGECYFCHELDDKHRGINGRKCDSCHKAAAWATAKFDHDKDTRFKLEHMHSRLVCEDCHKKNIFKEKLGVACYGCHKLSDKHQGRYGRDCSICHNTRSWTEQSFDHNEDTKFWLRGKHGEIYCEDCHKGMVFKEDLGTSCVDCHKQDDVHRGQEGKECEKCHDERGWPTKVVFDHAISRFPLFGTHVFVPCEECHVDTAYKDAKIDCLNCHKGDDEDSHKERMGQKCERCHQSYDWLAWSFDHNEESDFDLDGAHEGIDCHSCHQEKVKDDKFELAGDCYSCHRKDDVHDGNLGTRCERCHITSTFKKQRLR